MIIKTIIFTFLLFNSPFSLANNSIWSNSEEIHSKAEDAMQKGNFAIAYCLWEPLANDGDSKAQFNIGWMFHNGYGLAINDDTAFNWWIKAAEQGNTEAFFSLADLYLAGFGVDKDKDIAMGWYIAAAEKGHLASLEVIYELASHKDKFSLFYHNKLIEDDWFWGLAKNGDKYALSVITSLAKFKKHHAYLTSKLKQGWSVFKNKIAIKVERANVRRGPGTGNKIVTSLSQGDELVAFRKQGNWTQIGIKDSGKIAWIFSKLTQPVTPESEIKE